MSPSFSAAVLSPILLLMAAEACATEPVASAASCPDDAALRLSFIRDSLRRTAKWSRVWYGSWIAGYGALAVGSAAAAGLAEERNERIANGISAGSSLIGAALIAIDWPVAISESETLEALAFRSTNVCATLAHAERGLRQAADRQLLNRRWYWHVVNVAYAVVTGLIIGIVTSDWLSAGLEIGVGAALGEASILTMPNGSLLDYERYLGGQYHEVAPNAPQLSLVHFADKGGFGLRLAVLF